jgi:hypothetical protein
METTTPNAFTEELQKRLLSQSDMISSANTGLETKINEAIGGVSKANEASAGAITSSYDRQIAQQGEKDQNAITAVRERGVGVGTSDVAYKALAKEADTNLKDLEQRKQELILQGNSAAASKIADLQMQTLEFKTKAMQQTFTNLMGMGNFGLQVQSERRQADAQDWNQKAAVKTMGLQYGVTVGANDTLDTVAVKAGAVAGKKAQLELEQMASTIRNNNAQASKALKDGSINLANASEVDGLMNLALTNPQEFKAQQLKLIGDGKLDQAGKMAEVSKRASAKQNDSFKSDVADKVSQGYTLPEVIAELVTGNVLDAEGAVSSITKFYTEAKASAPAKKGYLESFKGYFNQGSLPQTGTPTQSQTLMNSMFTSPNSLFDPSKLFGR